MVRAMPSPKRVGGGLPVQSEGAGGGGGDLLDLMSMDIGGDGGGAEAGSSPERAPEDGSSADEGDTFLAIEAAPQSAPAQAAAAAAAGAGGGTATQAKKKKKAKSAGKKTFNLIDFDEEGEEDGGAGEEEGEGGDAEEEEEEEVAYSEGAIGPEATVFEVVFPPGRTPNILLEESQPGNKLTVKSFPKRADGSRGTAETDGKIEKGDFLLAVNSIRLEGLGFNDAIRVLTTQA
ncbi:unnamed protein product, partial [Ectocarpus sp. 6 AP-2014]